MSRKLTVTIVDIKSIYEYGNVLCVAVQSFMHVCLCMMQACMSASTFDHARADVKPHSGIKVLRSQPVAMET